MGETEKGLLSPSPAPAKARKVSLATFALTGALALAACAKAPVCAPVSPEPDFQKAVLIKCMGGDQLVDMYLSGFRHVSTPDRVEFLVSLQLAPCPLEAQEWARRRAPAPPPQPSPTATPKG